MMCSTLLSDAEAFKAANLNARFEDFIRWYSPNDWEECTDDEGVKHHKLSARMSAEGNTWRAVWEQSKPVPVSRQVSDSERNLLEKRCLGFYFLTFRSSKKCLVK